ncbi:V-type ATP synthase subunit E [uncultured Peptoniphilus sp.]|uniref:V-type ATP synthase subunit E n=1 Tax=uncultured Peptoniphilus sp. TaxID=254354 RepID=UPI00258A6188|nr:V-type ATP synthase subunit E [uncultured Peptoniphilus sp.]MDU6784144.1 V-type ATP synthase subunit E [Peptoniphilus harei]
MAGLENILNKIIEDAKTKADEIIKEAEEKQHLVVEKREDDAKFLADKINEISKKEREEILKRAKSSTELKARDNILAEKHKLIDKILKKAVAELENLSEEDFIKFVKNNVKGVEDKNSILDVPSKYRDAVKNANLGFKVSETDVERGFVLHNGNLIYNGDFKSIVKSEREDLEKFLAEKLFS